MPGFTNTIADAAAEVGDDDFEIGKAVEYTAGDQSRRRDGEIDFPAQHSR